MVPSLALIDFAGRFDAGSVKGYSSCPAPVTDKKRETRIALNRIL
jgi:hypothetical protein